ncbi:hypothetical protein GCM10007423_39860 [Dyadobacter endophyticus]|uniref:Uncharacterized protein n=1 Tax=Dyadobacter endophyticus TaxID=1749036 RepID=A0ABQ1Z039_9BACT|nr:hypothetical protein [Dyadobacter endophyticus]GGH42894.1 hypothetical protein GCM10007423_39860 [Dyadobacter endophyticus]
MLGYLLTSEGVDLQRLHNYNSEADQTLGAYIALGFVDPSVGLRIGGTYEAETVSGTNIVSIIKGLCKEDLAYFFGNADIIGQEADPAVTAEAEVFGNVAGPRLTDTLIGTTAWRLYHAYSARNFLNMLMANREFDLFMFTNNSVEAAYFDEHGVSYTAISNAKSNKDAKITGGFTTMYKSLSGFLPVEFGVSITDLKNDVKFVIADPTASEDVTVATCSTAGRKKYTKLLADAGTLIFAANPANACLDWYCTQQDGSPLPPAGKGSFNSGTATLTLPNTLQAGKYVYKIFCVNATGVKGEIFVEVLVN